MYWYNIQKNHDEYIVFKNVVSKNAIGSRRIFCGLKDECVEYCKSKEIKLGKRYKRVIK